MQGCRGFPEGVPTSSVGLGPRSTLSLEAFDQFDRFEVDQNSTHCRLTQARRRLDLKRICLARTRSHCGCDGQKMDVVKEGLRPRVYAPLVPHGPSVMRKMHYALRASRKDKDRQPTGCRIPGGQAWTLGGDREMSPSTGRNEEDLGGIAGLGPLGLGSRINGDVKRVVMERVRLLAASVPRPASEALTQPRAALKHTCRFRSGLST